MKIIRTHESSPADGDAMEREWRYNGLDCCQTLEIFDVIHAQLDTHTRGTYQFSRDLQGPVLEMRLRGILIDTARKAEVIEEFFNKLDQLEANLDRIVLDGVGLEQFNWRSTAHLKELFYGKLQIPPIKSKGKISVDINALEKLEAYIIARPIVKHIIAMRELGKKIGVLRTTIDPDNRIRTSYNIAGTNTGRFSSSMSEFGTGGNLQNVEESLRSIFIADPGMKFAKFDAKSGESFVVGAIEWNLFNDDKYLRACESGDPHTAVARICWPELPWTGDLKRDKDIAESPFYRHYTYRFMCKKLGHGCLTTDHEVLTRNGWVNITEKPSEIMCWNEVWSGFDTVTHWTDFAYDGDLQEFEGNSISASMTHDHRIPYKSDVRNLEISERPASKGPGAKMPLGDDYEGGDVKVHARFLAAFMADGCQEGYGLAFHFRKQRKIIRLKKLCDEANLLYREYHNSDGTTKILVKDLGIQPKHPGAFMFNWTEKCLREFIDELKHWDGHISETAVSISSKHREDLEWFQTFGRLLGIGGQISGPYTSGYGTQMYKLQQNNRKWAAGASIRHLSHEVQDERVLCPTVNTGWFFVRRNGKIFVTGNSNYGGQPFTLATQAKLPIGVVQQFQPVYFANFPAHREWQRWVETELQTRGYLISLTGRKRWFMGRRNDADTLRGAIAYDPQCSLAEIVNRGMLNVWKARDAVLVMQDHDAITVMYLAERENEVVPKIIAQLAVSIPLAKGRTLDIPYDAKVGWNRGDWSPSNPFGLKDFTGNDPRKFVTTPSFMDRPLSR